MAGILLLASTAIQAQVSLRDWVIEDHSGEARISEANDTLEITAPKGLTLWYSRRLTGDYEICYNAKFIMEGGQYDRLSDLNCFWAANDPKHPDDLHARGAWRNGIFRNYKTLTLFYVGYGGNYNTTTRFREYLGGDQSSHDSVARPVIREYTDPDHLLKPDIWYNIRIRVQNGLTTYSINGEELFRLAIRDGQGDGSFGLRLLENHILFTGFTVQAL